MRLNLKTSAMVFSVGCTALVYGLTTVPTEKAARRADRAPSDISATFGSEDQARSLRVHSRRASDGVRPLGVPETLLPPPIANGLSAKPLQNPQFANATTELYGTLLYSSGLTSGLYRIPTSDGGSFELMTSQTKPAKNGAVVQGRQFIYPVQYPTGEITMSVVDIDTWEVLSNNETTSEILATAAVYDPTTDCVYGCYYYDENTEVCFGIGHYPSGHVTRIADMNRQPLAALAVNAEGQLYGIDYNGVLYSIDKTDGSKTTIGNTGVVSQYNTSGAIDPSTGVFYFAKSTDAGGWLYTIDTTTAAATLINTFPTDEEIGGMFVKPDDYAGAAPAMPTDVNVQFEGSSTDGKISFRTPATNYDGSSPRGTLTYTVRANGKTLASATAGYDQEVTVNVSLQGATNYSFVISAANSAGTGPAARVTRYVGKDTPTVPNVKATFLEDENAIFLTWDPVESGVSGGYIDPAGVTYTVTRIQDNVIVADGISETNVKDQSYGSGSRFQYQVVAHYDGRDSQPGISNVIDMSVKYPPYLETFETKDPFTNEYTFIGSGKGDNKWTYYKSGKILRAYYDFDYPKDEWLLTPAIMLEAGKQYKFSFLTYTGSNSYDEHLEVYIGMENTVAGMTDKLVDKIWSDKTPETVEVTVSPTETGKYYFGFHACSEEDTLYIYLDDIAVSAPTGDNVPEAVSDLTVTPGADCAKTATISFTTPSITISGHQLQSLSKVEIYRESALVKTIENPEVATAYSCEDEVPTSASHAYSVYCYNEDGMGKVAKASAYVGIKIPTAPRNVVLTENDTPGNVTLTWDAPLTYSDGSPVHEEHLYYAVRSGGRTVLVSGIQEKNYTFQAIEPDTQNFVQFEVIALTEGGQSAETTNSNVLLVGTPQPAPYSESFKNGSVGSPIGTSLISGSGGWKTFSDKSFAELNASDGDNGYVGFVASSADSSAALLTGRYNLAGLTGTALSLYTFPVGELARNDNAIALEVNDGSGWHQVKEVKMSDLSRGQSWNKIIFPLSEYDGKIIQLKIVVTNHSYVYTYLDNITLDAIRPHALEVAAVNTPYIVNPDEDFDVVVTVANNGITTTGDYTVSLLKNEVPVGTVEGTGLVCGDLASYKFNQKLDLTDEHQNAYRAEIEYAVNPSDAASVSDEFFTTLSMPVAPVVTDLAASGDGNAVVLSWSQPDLSDATPAQTTEDFESYTPWAMGPSLGDWLLVDRDQAIIGGTTEFTFPGVPGIGQGRLSYFVMDRTWSQIANSSYYEAHSGNQYLSNMYNYTSDQNDDWVISPELYGGLQIITVYAKSFDSRYPEAMEILYSTTDRNPESFRHAASFDPLPDEWTACQAVMPYGAKYFAVRAVSFDAFMMFVDDFSYIPAGAPESLTVEGYHIYRDGVRLSESPVAQCNYVDSSCGTDNHKYFVTAVYADKGESPASNIVEASYSAVANIQAGALTVKAAGGDIVITGATGNVSVCDAAGRAVYSAPAADKNIVKGVGEGVYIIRADNGIRKLILNCR